MGKTWKGRGGKTRDRRKFGGHGGGTFRPREQYASGSPPPDLHRAPLPPGLAPTNNLAHAAAAAVPAAAPQAGDKTLMCVDCGQPFEFNSGEQAFYKERNLSDPRRCKPCRELKKARNQQGR